MRNENDLEKTNSESIKLRVYLEGKKWMFILMARKFVTIKLLKICNIHIHVYINYIDEYGSNVITFVKRNILILDFVISDSVRTHMLWLNSEKKFSIKLVI